MAEEKKEGNGNGKDPKIEKLILNITFSNEGQFNVDGNCLNNEAMALWMLEKTKDLIKLKAMQNLKSQIVKPNFIQGIRNILK